MLTPGEFVINKQATQKYRPLLEQINGNKANVVQGGIQYRQTGGFINSKSISSAFDSSSLNSVFEPFNKSVTLMSETFGSFGNHVSRLEQYANTIKELHVPDRIEMQGTHSVNLNVNGLAVLNGLEDVVRNVVLAEIQKATGGYQLNSNSGIPSGMF
ncbi:MAG: hypothetical protein LBH00_01180 [Planctomycetaceae bacterium]|jgi:hypothetical protein|nr:hypothetical protein [Planctomycetaceae bacterium]